MSEARDGRHPGHRRRDPVRPHQGQEHRHHRRLLCPPWASTCREVRIVPDVEAEIVAAVNALRARYTYLFTTGGIGPTHDDITADSVAKAFGVGIAEHPEAIRMLLERIAPEDLNEARRRMARIPDGAELIRNDVSKAPGFMLGNVIVMAGVPAIMRNMLDNVAPRLEGGARMAAESIDAEGLPEGAYAAGLGALAKAHPGVSIGSYPSFSPEGFRNQIVVRGRDAGARRRGPRGGGGAAGGAAGATASRRERGTARGRDDERARRQGLSGLLGPVPPRLPGAGLAAVGGRALRRAGGDHARRPRAGRHRGARTRHPHHRDGVHRELPRLRHAGRPAGAEGRVRRRAGRSGGTPRCW